MPSGDLGFVILLLLHIASVIAWMGSAILLVYVISPSLQKISYNERREFMLVALPRFGKVVRISSLTTLVAGLILLGYVGSVNTSLFPSGIGLFILLTGAVLGLVAYIVANFVVVPSAAKLLRILANVQTSSDQKYLEELGRQQDLVNGGSRGVLVLLAIVLILMVSGTYL